MLKIWKRRGAKSAEYYCTPFLCALRASAFLPPPIDELGAGHRGKPVGAALGRVNYFNVEDLETQNLEPVHRMNLRIEMDSLSPSFL